MLRIAFAFAFAVAMALGAQAEAGVVITVDKTAQHLSVAVDGVPRYEWPVSTARIGYRTPNGTYRPERLERQWFSRRYDWSPMPHSIFFSGGYAIHGSYEISRLGRRASHGCIRLHPANAAVLYALVQRHTNDTRIVITGGDGPAMADREPARRHERASLRSTWRKPAYSRHDARRLYQARPVRRINEYRYSAPPAYYY
ncbi:MAG: L,D-transpeptidase, partial [Candidatus Binataceae bacterium]